ncbi:MAG TPA: hypothetical protein VFX80_10480 [Solirubrobacteraceae bacterium]|nr:hypothetical protein [Solirubrobacteraceae bacterium]
MIVEVEELVSYMSNVSLTADQRRGAELVLEGVQGEVETFINRSLEPGEFIETLVPDEDGYVYFSQTPVNEIVHVHAPPPDPLPDPYVPADLWYDFAEGQLLVGPYAAGVQVRYRYGLPAHAYRFLKLEVLRIAAREVTSLHDDTLGVTDTNTRTPAPPPIGLTEEDERRLRRWKRRVAV